MIVIGDGGSGKTMLSKQLCRNWASRKNLQSFDVTVRIDVNNINCEKDIFYSILRVSGYDAEMTIEELQVFLKQSKDKVLIILDGLYEASVHSKSAVNRFFGEEAILPWATVLIFTRPEAISKLNMEATEVKQFQMQKLTFSQVEHFVLEQYPFEDQDAGRRLLQECRARRVPRSGRPC